MTFTNKTYDTLKWIAQYLLPGLGTLYFTLASIWGLPYGEQIIGTISALTIFLSVILGISTSNYLKTGKFSQGALLIDTHDPEKDIYRLQLKDDLSALSDKKAITLLVDSHADLSQE